MAVRACIKWISFVFRPMPNRDWLGRKEIQTSPESTMISMRTVARLKASLKIWIVIYPALTLSLHVFGEPLSALPLYLRTLVLTFALVPLIVFLGVPLVDRVLNLLAPQAAGNR